MSGDEFGCGDGTRLHVVEDGAPSSALTIVLVHCYAMDHSEWDPLLPALAAAIGTPVRVLRYDHRGYGESDGVTAETATLAQLADDLAELISGRVSTGPVVLVGHSMGGMTIMALAERHPELVAERIAGLAFVATACGGLRGLSLGLPGPVAALVHRLERVSVWALSAVGRPVLTRYPRVLEPFVRWLVFGDNPKAADVAQVARLLAACRPVTMLLFRPDFDAHDRREALANLAGSPATVLVGEKDRLTPLRLALEIIERLPGATFITLPGAGHMLPYERTSEVAAAIAELAHTALGRTTTAVG